MAFSRATLLLPRRGQPYFHCQDGGQPCFHCQNEASHAFIAKMRAATISYAKDGGSHAFTVKTRPAILCQDGGNYAIIAGTEPAIFSLPRQGQPCFHRQDEPSHAFIAKTGSDAFFDAAFMRFYRNQSQRRIENRQKMPQELSVDRTIPLGISTLHNYVQYGCIRRAAPHTLSCVFRNRSYTLTRYTSLLCSVMGYTHHTDIPLNRRCVV